MRVDSLERMLLCPAVTRPQVGFGYVLPLLVTVVVDFEARRVFARRHAAHLCASDRQRWPAGKLAARAFTPAGVALLVYAHFMTALWFGLLQYRGVLRMPTSAEVMSLYRARLAAAPP